MPPSPAMTLRSWFATPIYAAPLQPRGGERLRADLEDECRRLRDFDAAGRRWSARHYPGGYTSYASMNELHRFSSTFATLERRLLPHVRRFARELADCGVRRINISLDTLDPARFRALTRTGDHARVMDGIDAALDAGLKIKLNAVALKGVNEDEVEALVRFAHARLGQA